MTIDIAQALVTSNESTKQITLTRPNMRINCYHSDVKRL